MSLYDCVSKSVFSHCHSKHDVKLQNVKIGKIKSILIYGKMDAQEANENSSY